jgi:hypothetical protein
MLPDRYVWFVWSVSFLVPWALLFGLCPGYRQAMWWASLLTLPFGLSEPLFLDRYWEPPSLFDLAQCAHFDLESFIFCFGIGGVAAVGYNALTGRPLQLRARTAAEAQRQSLYTAALALPAPVFGAVLFLTRAPIWAGLAGFVAGIAGRLVVRRDLAAKTVLGGLLFLGYYLLFLLYLNWLAAGYLQRVWLTTGPASMRVFGLPVTEIAFALGFGMFWSGLFEQIDSTFCLPMTVPDREG